MIARAIGGVNPLFCGVRWFDRMVRLPADHCRGVVGSKRAVARQQRPDDSRVLVGQGHRCHVPVSPAEQPGEPAFRVIRPARGDTDHRARPVNEQRPHIGIPPLADAQQRGFAPAGALLGDQPQPGGQLPAILELPGVADGRHQGAGRERADSRDRGQFATRGLLSMPSLDLRIQFIHLPIQSLKMRSQALQQLAQHPGQLILAVLQDFRQALGNVADALRNDNPVLGQESADLVGLRRPRFDEALPGAMQRQHRLLFAGLDRHEAHRWSGHRLADRLGIRRVVLVGLHVGLDKLRSHESHRMPELLKLPRPVMRPATGLHANATRFQVGEKWQDLRALQLPFEHDPAPFVDAVKLKHVLCQIQPDRRHLHRGRPFRYVGSFASPPWHINAVLRKGRPFH